METEYRNDDELEKLLSDLKNVKREDFEFHDPEASDYTTGKGLNKQVVEEISEIKKEPEWMKRLRLRALEIFNSKPMPTWGPDLSGIDWENISYYNRPGETKTNNWDEVPDQIKDTFSKLGIPEMEQKYLAGSVAQYDSEGVYHNLKKVWEDKGVVFMDLDSAVRNYPDLVKDYFCRAVPFTDNKFAALNGAVWSGGSFLYVPKGVQIDMPLQTYFRMNGESTGQFEHTMVIADEGSKVHYIEGCLPAEELVSKGDDFVPINSISLKEDVMTHTGESSDVTYKFVRPYNGTMLTITPLSRGNEFKLTVEHPVLSIKRASVSIGRKTRNGWKSEVSTQKLLGAKADFVRAEELEEGDFIVYVAPTMVNDDESFDESILKILGLYAAEGSISYNKAIGTDVLAFSFGKSDKEKALATELYYLIKSMNEQANFVTAAKGYHTVASYSRKLIELCKNNVGCVASEKKFSKAVMELPSAKQKLLIDYYLKGDGNVYVKKPFHSTMVRASTVSRIMSLQLQEMLARNGIFANITVRKGGKGTILGRNITRKDQYIVQYTVDKKYSEVRRSKNIFYVPIKKISREPYSDLVYNLEVSKQNTYLVKGFAVHNCTAPRYDKNSLHSAIVEIYVKKNARARYTSVQNWSKSVYNMPTKRAWVDENAQMEWVGGSLGSKVTMLYPSSYLRGAYASASNLNVALAGAGTYKDTGAKALHFAPHTTSKIIAKSISVEDGKAIYRGLLRINKGAEYAKSHVQCDALLINDESSSYTYPHDEIYDPTATFAHEATVGRIGTEELTYLRSRGLSEEDASSMIVLGFLDDVMREIPMEFAVEMNRLIKLEMGKLGAVG